MSKSLSPTRERGLRVIDKSTMKDNGSVIKVDFEEEVAIMRKAHKILLRKHTEQKQEKGDFDKAPSKTFDDFLNFTTVKQMMDEQVIPVVNMIPVLKKEIRTLNSNLKEVAGQTKSAFNELKNFQEEMKQLNAFNARMETIKQDLEYFQVLTKNQQIEIGNRLIEIGQNRDADLQAMELIRVNMQGQTLKMEEFKVQIDRNHQKFESIFDTWFETQNKDSKQMRSRMVELDKRQERVESSVREHSSKIQKTLDKTIKKIFDDEAISQLRISALEKKSQMHDKKLINIRKLEMNMEELLKSQGDSVHHAKFLSESLPILIHLQICEGLDKVIGPDYREPLQTFEMKKLEEIHKYATCRADASCIRLMHERLLTFMRFFRKHDKGVFAFTYGEDIHNQMQQEELNFMHQSYDLSIKKRFDTYHVKKVQFKEALDQALVDPEKQSPIVMKHKLSRLDSHQLLQLKNQILEHKVRKLDNFDDLYPVQSNPMFGRSPPQPRGRGLKKPRRNDSSDSDSKKETTLVKGPTFPEKVFVVKREGLKPYNRLNNKFQALFDLAYKQLKEFKDTEVLNFTRTTQLTLQVSSELELVKKVVDATLEQLEEHEEKYSNKMIAIEKRFETFNELLEKKMRQVSKDQKSSFDQFQKIEKQLMMDSVRIDKFEKETIEMQNSIKAIEKSIQKLEDMNSRQMENTKKMIGSLTRGQSLGASDKKNTEGVDLGDVRSSMSAGSQERKRVESLESGQGEGKKKITLKAAAKAVQFGARINQGARQKMKIEAQQKREQAKRVEEQAQIRKQEREIRYEQQALEKNLEAGHDPSFSPSQNKAMLAIKAEKKRRKEEMVRQLRAQSKTSKLGQVFLTKLGDQKVQNEIQSDKMDQKKERLGAKKKQMSSASGSQSKRSRGVDIIFEGDLEDDNDNEFMDTMGIDSMDSRFMNPFAQPRAFDQQQKPGMDMDQLEEYVKPRLDAIWAVIDHNKTTINVSVSELNKREKENNEKTNTLVNENFQTLQERINTAMSEIEAINQGKDQFESRIKFDIDQVAEQMEFEKQAIVQQRKATKNEINHELKKIQDQNDTARVEFQRINTILERYKDILTLLNQDSMLMQMLQEQDVLDRKQIGLFGLKKNQQILGTNQYSMSNNLMRATQFQDKKLQKGRNTSVGSDQKKFWELKNKERSYREVVSASVDVGENARGLDQQKKIQDANAVKAIRQFNQSPSPERDELQEMNADIFSEPHAGSKFYESTPNSSFMERFESNQQFNTLYLNRDCASCVTGMAPQIITQLKLACLSYVSSPIVYGVGLKKQSQLEMQVQDVIQIKEYLLQKCQSHCSELEELLQILPTTYGTLDLPMFSPGSFLTENPNANGRQTINLDIFQEQMNQMEGRLNSEIQIGQKEETSPGEGDFHMEEDVSPLKPQNIENSPNDTLKKQQLTEMLETGQQEGGFSRGSLKLNETQTMHISRDTSPQSPYPIQKHMRKGSIGVDKVEILNEQDMQSDPKTSTKKSDQKFLNEVQSALNRLKDMPLSKPKYHVEIIQQFMEAKCQNRNQLSVQNFLQTLLIQKVEDVRKRHEKSHLLKLKSYKLNYAQSRDLRMKDSNIFENQVNQSYVPQATGKLQKSQQKASLKSKTNTGYMHKLPSSGKIGGYGSMIFSQTSKNGQSQIHSVDAKSKIAAYNRFKGNQSMQGLNSVNQYLQNQAISSPAKNMTNFASKISKKDQPKKDFLSISMPFSPLHHDFQNTNPRTSKNTRYETIDGCTELDADTRANLNKKQSQQFSPENSQPKKNYQQKRIGTSGGQYPQVKSDQEIELPDVQVTGEKIRNKSAIGFASGQIRRPIPVQGNNIHRKDQIQINSSLGSATNNRKAVNSVSTRIPLASPITSPMSGTTAPTRD